PGGVIQLEGPRHRLAELEAHASSLPRKCEAAPEGRHASHGVNDSGSRVAAGELVVVADAVRRARGARLVRVLVAAVDAGVRHVTAVGGEAVRLVLQRAAGRVVAALVDRLADARVAAV